MILAGLCLTAVAAVPPTAMDVGSSLQWFVDDAGIDHLAGSARRQLHHPVPANAILAPDAAWEGITSAYLTVFRDGDRVRFYYRGSNLDDTHETTCYAESTDGITFTKPRLGLHEVAGTKDNNVVWHSSGCHNFAPFLDANPAAPAAQRYKAVGGLPLHGYVSPDGLHWQLIQPDPILTKGAFDSQNIAFWDTALGCYVCYFRTFRDGVRAVERATSPDFVHWSEATPLSYGTAPAEHLYTNGIVPYFRNPQLYLGLPARFVPDRKKVPTHPEAGVSDGVLMASRDGLSFQRWREGFIVPGLTAGDWTDRTNYPAWGVVQTSPTEMSVYWTEHYRHPDFVFRRGVLRLDGFVSVRAEADGGTLLTRPLVFSGTKLVLNYATSAIGSVKLSLVNGDGQTVASSEELYGNEIAHSVVWKTGNLRRLAGQPVRLKVELMDADLYSFQFVP